jgi:hypothetical protein
MIKHNFKIINSLQGCAAFAISGNRKAATKCLLLQQGHPAQAPVNKD